MQNDNFLFQIYHNFLSKFLQNTFTQKETLFAENENYITNEKFIKSIFKLYSDFNNLSI